MLEAFLDREPVRKIIDRRFVLVRLTVYEDEAHKALENEGARGLFQSWGSSDTPLPFYAILDEKGVPVVASDRPYRKAVKGDERIAYPIAYGAIGAFLRFLKEGNPSITDKELWVLRHELEEVDKGWTEWVRTPPK